jgi:hypothetical protein
MNNDFFSYSLSSGVNLQSYVKLIASFIVFQSTKAARLTSSPFKVEIIPLLIFTFLHIRCDPDLYLLSLNNLNRYLKCKSCLSPLFKILQNGVS